VLLFELQIKACKLIGGVEIIIAQCNTFKPYIVVTLANSKFVGKESPNKEVFKIIKLTEYALYPSFLVQPALKSIQL